jgi:LytS/YehU family sensor histidine kinase
LLILQINQVIFDNHVDSFILQILVDNVIVNSTKYCGFGNVTPRYGFKSIALLVKDTSIVSYNVKI